MVHALALIGSLAPEYEARVIAGDALSLKLEVDLRRADELIVSYRIRACATGPNVSAQEEAPNRLPARCPERHINGDGTFCMYWQGETSLAIDSEDVARLWWETLIGYLKLQERAERLRRWPNDNAWAHGSAARHQQKALEAAARISSQLEVAVKRRHLQVKHRGPHGRCPQMIYVSHQGTQLYSVRILQKPAYTASVTKLRQPCLCGAKKKKNGKPITLRKCHRHASDAKELALELLNWEKEEEQFWMAYKGQKCCGKISNCPLAENGIVQMPINT
jgi:hypothetical protein